MPRPRRRRSSAKAVGADGARAARAVRTRLAALAGVALFAALLSCGSAPRPIRPEVDLMNPSASRRLEAVAVTAATRDSAQIPTLFALLDDDDDSVRAAAADALRTLVGGDPGYRAYAPREERLESARIWRARSSPTRAGPSPGPASPPAAPPVYTGK